MQPNDTNAGPTADAEPVSRRRVLQSAAIGVTGTAAITNGGPEGQAHPQPQPAADRAAQETTTPEPDAPLLNVSILDSDPGRTDDVRVQPEVELGDTAYPTAEVENIGHDGEIRIAYHWYVLGGAGLYLATGSHLFTDHDSDGWSFWLDLDTGTDPPEADAWVQGDYTVVCTVTDFHTGHATTDTATLTIT